MMILKAFLPIVGVVYGAYVLWPNSHCERALHASIPAYWAGSLIHLASEPFIEEQQTLQVSRTTAERFQVLMANGVARLFYNRDSLQHLCETDAIQILRQAGKINERGLIALPNESLARKTQSAIPMASGALVGSPGSASDIHGEAEWIQWLQYVWLLALAAFIFIKPLRDALMKIVFEGKIFGIAIGFLRRLWMAHKQLIEHVLPRSVIRPTAGKKKTDLSE